MTTNEVIRNIERNFAILESARDAGFCLTVPQTKRLSSIANRIATWNVSTHYAVSSDVEVSDVKS